MAERRRHTRTRKRLRVLYGENDLSKVGFTRDVSAGGMFILCNGPLPPTGTRLHVQIFLNQVDFLLMEGERVHAKQVPPALRTSGEQGFGVRFLLPVEALAELSPVATEPATGSGAKLSAAPQAPTFFVEYSTIEDLKTAWARELRHGGLFIATTRLLERDHPVAIQVNLPFAAVKMEVTGRVLQPQAGANPGLSLAFGDARRVLKVLEPFVR